MKKFRVRGYYGDPKKVEECIQFNSFIDYLTREEAQVVLKEWKIKLRYPDLWVEEVSA